MPRIPLFKIRPETDLGTMQMQFGCIKSDQTKLWTPVLLICQKQKQTTRQNVENVL